MKKIFLLSISALFVAIGSPVYSSSIDQSGVEEVTGSFERVAKRLTGCKNLETFQTKTNPLYSDDVPRVALKDLKFEEFDYGGGSRKIIENVRIGCKAKQFGRVHELCLDNGHPWTATKKGGMFSSHYSVAFIPGFFLKKNKSPFIVERQGGADATYSKKDDQTILDTLHLADLYQLHLTNGRVEGTADEMFALWGKYRISIPMLAQAKELSISLTHFGGMLGFESKGDGNRFRGALATLKSIASVEQDRNDLVSALLLSTAPGISMPQISEDEERAEFFDRLWLSLLENRTEREIFTSSYNEGSKSGSVYDSIERNTRRYSELETVLSAFLPSSSADFAFTFFTKMLGENSTFYQNEGKSFDFNKLFGVKDAPFLQHVELDG